MVINKKTSKVQKFCALQIIYFFIEIGRKVCISSSYDSVTSSHGITESSIILDKYFPFSQIHV